LFVNRIPKKPLSQIDSGSFKSFSLTSEDQQSFKRGISLFNSGRFWEAHEAWEEIWQRRPEDARVFIQGLIQLAAAYHQLKRQIYRGADIHLRQAEERLKLFPPDFLGIDVRELYGEIADSIGLLDSNRSAETNPFQRIVPSKIRML